MTIANNTTSPGGDDDHGGDTLQEWSSLIGIITAIVGNVLIALALNVQRYAHIRLHKEQRRVRLRAREALKRAQNNHHLGGSYGTISDESNGRSNGHGRAAGFSGEGGHDDEENANHNNEAGPLMDSFRSDSSDELEGVDGHGKVASTYLKSPYWWLGQVLITLGEMGNFLAYGFAPASIVSPLGVVALISNCIIAPAMFHEPFRQRDFWGVVIAVSGVVTVVLSARQEETKLNPHDVWDAITSLAFEIYMGVTILLIIILMWASERYGRRTILIDLGLVGLFGKLIMFFCAGVDSKRDTGGYTALATKGVSSMLSSTLWRAFTTPVTYVLIVILLGTAVMQIRYVNKALQRFDSTQVIPIQFVMFTLCVILGSAILYRDFERTTAEQAGKFVGGCLLTFFGVFLITSGRKPSNDDDDLLSEAEGVEETIGLASHDGIASLANQDAPTTASQSRRSSRVSRVSFAETVRPLTPQHQIDIPSSLRLMGNLQNSPTQESGPILSNPWQEYAGDVAAGPSTPPARGIRTFSTDSVLTGCAVGSTPARSNPTTPMRDSQVPPSYPTEGPTLPRPGLGSSKPGSHHRSGTFISPSPLASTVTAVVKDAFLRTTGEPRAASNMSSIRRIRSSIRASLFFSDDNNNVPDRLVGPASEGILGRAFSEATTPGPNEGSPKPDEDQVRRRSRSVSDTLGGFFGVRKKRRKTDYFSSDLEDDGLEVETQSFPDGRTDNNDV